LQGRQVVQAGSPALWAANFLLSGAFPACRFAAPRPAPWIFLTIHNNNKMTTTMTTTSSSTSPITMGKYRIAACPRPLEGGRFAAQVSIASGSGRGTTDRVMRFHDHFPTHDAAAHYALAQGIVWVHETTRTQ
jgi:hypothetical protein